MKKFLCVFVLLFAALLLLASCDNAEQPPTNDENSNPTAHTHEFGEWRTTQTPTCLQNGEETRYCNCGEKQTGVIVPTGHNYQSTKTLPTCTTKGITTYPEIEQAAKSWMGENVKHMSKRQVSNIKELYQKLFGKELRWKQQKSHSQTARRSSQK